MSNETNPYTNLAGALLSGVFASLAKDSRTAEQVQRDRERNANEWEINHLKQINYIRDQIDFWKEVAMGQVVLMPKKEASGRILFPVEEKATGINVKVNIKGKIKGTFYKQEIITQK